MTLPLRLAAFEVWMTLLLELVLGVAGTVSFGLVGQLALEVGMTSVPDPVALEVGMQLSPGPVASDVGMKLLIDQVA